MLELSSLGPEDVNISEGLAGTLVDRLVAHRNEHDRCNGVNRVDVQAKQRKTAQTAIENNKKLTAGLIVCAGTCRLGQDILRGVEHNKMKKQTKLCEKEKRERMYMMCLQQK